MNALKSLMGSSAGHAPARTILALPLAVLMVAFLLGAPWIIPMVAADFWLNVLTEILIWSLFAASVNLLFGYAGLLSFGQALYFGCGAYGVAFGLLYLGLGFWGAFLLGVVLATAMAALAGLLAVRLSWHYFAIITIVFSLIVYLLAVGAKSLTGGDDGLSFSPPPFFSLGGIELTILDQTSQYFFVLVVFALCLWGKHRLTKSPLGMAMMAVRENANRAGLIGIDVYRLRYTTFVLAGVLAGVSGSLFALFSRYASAQYLHWTVSGEGVIWTIVGGAGSLLGPVFGAGILILLREELSVYWEHYLLVLGVVIILMVTFAPTGLSGLYHRVNALLARGPKAAHTQESKE